MKKLLLIAFASATLLLFSCGENQNKTPKIVEQLTNRFFDYYVNGNLDSLQLLYSAVDFSPYNLKADSIFDFNADSIRITSIVEKQDGQIEVQLIKNFSPNNTLGSNIARSITILFNKAEEGMPFEYTIANSNGIVRPECFPDYVTKSGALNNQKYSDKEYLERWEIAKNIPLWKAGKIAEYIKNNVQVKVWADREKLFVERGYQCARFYLTNHTDYNINGFETTVYLKDKKYGGPFSQTWEFIDFIDDYSLHAHTKQFYRQAIPSISNFEDNVLIKSIVFSISPERVLANKFVEYDGTEYDEYLRENPVIEISNAN